MPLVPNPCHLPQPPLDLAHPLPWPKSANIGIGAHKVFPRPHWLGPPVPDSSPLKRFIHPLPTWADVGQHRPTSADMDRRRPTWAADNISQCSLTSTNNSRHGLHGPWYMARSRKAPCLWSLIPGTSPSHPWTWPIQSPGQSQRTLALVPGRFLITTLALAPLGQWPKSNTLMKK